MKNMNNWIEFRDVNGVETLFIGAYNATNEEYMADETFRKGIYSYLNPDDIPSLARPSKPNNEKILGKKKLIDVTLEDLEAINKVNAQYETDLANYNSAMNDRNVERNKRFELADMVIAHFHRFDVSVVQKAKSFVSEEFSTSGYDEFYSRVRSVLHTVDEFDRAKEFDEAAVLKQYQDTLENFVENEPSYKNAFDKTGISNARLEMIKSENFERRHTLSLPEAPKKPREPDPKSILKRNASINDVTPAEVAKLMNVKAEYAQSLDTYEKDLAEYKALRERATYFDNVRSKLLVLATSLNEKLSPQQISVISYEIYEDNSDISKAEFEEKFENWLTFIREVREPEPEFGVSGPKR